jgi:hypothetical protein
MTRRRCLLAMCVAACTTLGCADAGDPVRPVAKQQRDGRCPVALDPGARPLGALHAVLKREAARLASRESLQGFRVDAAFPLAPDRFAPGLRRRDYLRVAREACGDAVAQRSWVVVIDMPAASAASLGLMAVFLSRTADGWRAWHGWLPNGGQHGFFPGE